MDLLPGLGIFNISCRSLESSRVVSVPSRLVFESRWGVDNRVARRISLEDNRLACAGAFNDRNTPEVGVRVVGDKVADRLGGVPTRRWLPCLEGVRKIPLVVVLVVVIVVMLVVLVEGVSGPNDFSLNVFPLVAVLLMVEMDDDDDDFRGILVLPLDETLDCCCKLLVEFLGDGGGNREVVLVAMFLSFAWRTISRSTLVNTSTDQKGCWQHTHCQCEVCCRGSSVLLR